MRGGGGTLALQRTAIQLARLAAIEGMCNHERMPCFSDFVTSGEAIDKEKLNHVQLCALQELKSLRLNVEASLLSFPLPSETVTIFLDSRTHTSVFCTLRRTRVRTPTRSGTTSSAPTSSRQLRL